jgi:hypothetical protein
MPASGFSNALELPIDPNSEIPPPETMPDLMGGALARRDFDDAIRLLESAKKLGAIELNDLFILTYLYCVNG